MQKNKSFGKITGAFFVAAIFFLGVMAVLHLQDIYDWARLYNYQAPAAVATLADETYMNSYGRKLFYVNHPELDDKASFNGKCSSTEQSIVLGCYIETKGIFIYEVSDARLKGVQEVTAAHEMLHAAYDRLSSTEKAKVDALTAQVFANTKDQRLRDTIEAYRSKDPSVVPNELHSILGTEVRSLPPELETYYKKYFTDRSKVVSYSEAYEGEFTKRKTQIVSYDAQLASLKSEIESGEQSLDSQGTSLTSQREQLDKLLATKQYAAYNSQVDSFNTMVRQYNGLVSSTQTKIDQYNQIVAARNSIALEEQSLVKALDSRLQTQKIQ